MDNQSLIQITQILHNLERTIVENNGELSAELEAAISVETISKEKKIDSYFSILERCKSIEAELKAKIDILSKMAKNVNTIENRLKSNLKEAMTITGTDELQGNLMRFRLQNGGFKVKVIEETEIPISYFNEVVSYELDKERVKTELLAGNTVDGCTLEPIRTLRTYPAISTKTLEG